MTAEGRHFVTTRAAAAMREVESIIICSFVVEVDLDAG